MMRTRAQFRTRGAQRPCPNQLELELMLADPRVVPARELAVAGRPAGAELRVEREDASELLVQTADV
jgi:hypothetical protein